MAIKRKSNEPANWDGMTLCGETRAQKRYVGVRQRPSRRWVAEIKDTIQKIRVWLGTYDTAEEAARAYDEAACLLRGSNTRTNFWPSASVSSSPSALPSKIWNILMHRLKARNNAVFASPVSNNYVSINQEQRKQNQGLRDEIDDFIDYPDDYDTIKSNLIGHEDKEIGGGMGESDLKKADFNLMNQFGLNFNRNCYVPEIGKTGERRISEDEALMIEEATKQMTYEKELSGSANEFDQRQECLRLKLWERDDELMMTKKNEEETDEVKTGKVNVIEESLSDSKDCDLSLWSSLDLQPICFVN